MQPWHHRGMPKRDLPTDDAPIDNEFIDEHGRPNKSALKRRAQGLQDLGEVLIDLPQTELDALPLAESLRDAVMLARRITQHGGLYRQKQLIGKLMRKIDAEPIRLAIEARQARDRSATRQFQLIERWRGRLIQEKDAFDAFMHSYPTADRAHIQRLIEQARHERDNERPPKAARELFGVVQSIVKPATIPA
jgi:ribosome-associated protein